MPNADHIMTHEEDRAPLPARDVLHLADGFLLELGIADGQNLIYNQNLGLQMGCNGKAKANGHTRGIALDRGVDIAFTA